MNRADTFVSVIIPTEAEPETLRQVVGAVHSTLFSTFEHFEIVFVDDGWRQETRLLCEQLLKELDCLRYIRLSRKFGPEISITAGFENVIGDVIAVLDPEKDPTDALMPLISRVRQTGHLVLGRKPASHSPIWERIGKKLFYGICHRYLGIDLIPNTTHLMAMNRTVLNSVNSIKDKFRYFKAFTTYAGLPVSFHDYEPKRSRKHQRGFFQAISLAVDIVVSNSVRPLRLVSILAVSLSTINLIYIGYIVAIAFFKKHVAEGWVTLSTQNAVSFFVLSIILATLCEYAGRILIEAKDRPFYFITQQKTSSVLISEPSKRKNVVNQET